MFKRMGRIVINDLHLGRKARSFREFHYILYGVTAVREWSALGKGQLSPRGDASVTIPCNSV